MESSAIDLVNSQMVGIQRPEVECAAVAIRHRVEHQVPAALLDRRPIDPHGARIPTTLVV